MQPHKSATAIASVTHLPYSDTGYFSTIVTDYLQQNEKLNAYYRYLTNTEGLQQAINNRLNHPCDRKTLVDVLTQQYQPLNSCAAVQNNITLLLKENTFTITTAHQPNIFTGPLYFIYKILHAIKLAETFKQQLPMYHFVPVFFMGSEDADLDELGHFTVDGKRYEWKTTQTGAVGRMKVDKGFTGLIDELSGQLHVLPFGKEIISLFKQAYKEGSTIQQATLHLVNDLFGKYGLVVLVPDNPQLKKIFEPVVKKELIEQFSQKAVEQTINNLKKEYKVQAGGRALNLFYLKDDIRERIEKVSSNYMVKPLQLTFSESEIISEVEQHPERFSANVILRGVFQEMILPNIAFIGGGGEIAYWLELKKVFEEANVPYPMLVLRNSFLLLTKEQAGLLTELDLNIGQLFQSTDTLLNEITRRESANRLSLSKETAELNIFYQQLHETTSQVDVTLAGHVNNLQAKALKHISELEKKLLRAEKRKFQAEKAKIQKIKASAFANNSLQERVENISAFYARWGETIIDTIYRHSLSLEQEFTVITI